MTTLLRRTLLLSAAIVPLATSLASAQYRVDNGSARDANNRIGSGGFNDSRNDGLIIDRRSVGAAGNYVVTGNVTGGRSFRGNLGYTDASAFRGRLGSSDFDPFVRDSTGVGQIRGGYATNNGLTPQPFFGGRTVAPPPGFVRSQINNGTYVARTAPPILPNDGRADYGGVSRGAITQSLIDNRQQYGNAGFAPTTGTPFDGSTLNPSSNSPLQLSEFTTLARQRRDLFGAATNEDGTPRNPGRIDAPSNPFQTGTQRPAAEDPNDPNAPGGINDNRAPNAAPIEARPTPDADAQPGNTGQDLSRRPAERTGALANNSQYAQLRDRLEAARGSTKNDPRQTVGGPINSQPVGAGGGVSTGQGRMTTPTPTVGSAPSDTANPGARPTDGMPGGVPAGDRPTDRPAGERPTGERTTDRPTGDRTANDPTDIPQAGTSDAAAPKDNLNLSPDGKPAEVKPVPTDPVTIQTLSMGVKDQKLAKVLTLAEEQMRAGKFGSAIDTYEQAEEIASDDPLVFMGRSIAELGGGFFRNAEVHLRQAFEADQSLLYAKFDLRTMLGDDRLNQLATKLGDVANQNANDPGPLMLLAFIYYNGGMEDRAARALDMAQLRAGGKDKVVDSLRRTWSLSAPAAPGGEMNK